MLFPKADEHAKAPPLGAGNGGHAVKLQCKDSILIFYFNIHL